MKNYMWLSACVALVAAVLVAGCGGGGSSSSTSTPAISAGGSASTTSSSTTAASGQATPDDVYNACIDATSGTAAEQAGKTACAQARDAFQQCATQASNAPEGSARDTALKACQDAANKTT